MTALALIYGISLIAITLAALTAPMGWEDENGYHAGTPTKPSSTTARKGVAA